MFTAQKATVRLSPALTRMMKSGDLGSGAGKGGGGGGSIREAGGAFGAMEVAREEEYFYKKQKQQLQKLKADQIKQVDFHAEQIKEHEAAIQRHKDYLQNIKK